MVAPGLLAVSWALLLIGCAPAGTGEPSNVNDDVGFAETSAEAAERLQRCLSNEGWSVHVDEAQFNAVVGEYPEEQAAAFERDTEACMVGLIRTEPPSGAEMEDIFAKLQKIGDCLMDEGYSVPQSPSLHSWLAAPDSWSPYDDVIVQGGQAYQEAWALCPDF